MSQVSYGTIAITDLTDIKDMYLQYCMAVDSITTAAAIEAKTTWTSPEVNWFTLTADTTVNSNKRYYRLSNGDYYVVTPIGSENPSSNGWYEDTVYPSWQSGYQIWIREVRIKEGIELPEYGTPYLDKAVNQINTRIKKIWSNSTGSYMASGIEVGGVTREVDIDDSSTYGFNSKTTTTGISFNYNNYKTIELDGNIPALKLYEPSKTSQGTQTVQIDSNGMKLLKGGIEAGQAGQNGFIYLSTMDYPLKNSAVTPTISGITINGYTPSAAGTDGREVDDPAWRQIIGTKFGVDFEGNLYASNANIEGAITATSLTIGSGSDAYNGAAAINISGYDVEIEKNGTDETEGVTVYLYPILYHNGERVPDIEIDYTHFVWYQDDSTIGTEGSATDGSYLATYGHNYRVVYDFDDGAVGGGTEVQTRTIDPSKYITKIDDTGITIHPEVWSNQSSYIQLDGNGMELFNSNGNSIAQYGSTARIGLNNSSRFLINNNSLEGYDNNNNKYFEVNSNGLSWGSNTAATVSQFNTLNDYIDTHLAVTSEGLVLSADNNTKVLIATGGTGHTYDQAGTYIIDDSDNVLAQFLTYSTQIGRSGGSHSVIDAYGQRFYAMDGTTQLANIGYGEGATPTGGSSVASYYTFGTRSSTTVGNYSVVEGRSNNATGANSHAEGWTTSATGANSHAEGFTTRATGQHSHAEGGPNALSSGELISTTASGAASHAEGWGTKAYGSGSHSQNLMTIAAKSSQTALGTYNIQDAASTTTHPNGIAAYGQFAVIVGNGTDDARSNALTVDWAGNVWCAGGITATPTAITLTYSQCTTGSYTRCYRIGNMVFLSFNINVTTATASYDYITGLPSALGGGWATSSGFGSGAMTRWWVTTNGTLRADGTPTAGWHNGNIVYICQ